MGADGTSADNPRAALQLIVGFLSLADSKLSLIFGVDVAMLGYLSSRLTAWRAIGIVEGTGALATAIVAGVALWHVYRGLFPVLGGSGKSLLYFGEIANMLDTDFIRDFRGLTADRHADELLNQVHVVSRITNNKYQRVKDAFRWTLAAVVPWVVALAAGAAVRVP
jgi:hypothetical protein